MPRDTYGATDAGRNFSRIACTMGPTVPYHTASSRTTAVERRLIMLTRAPLSDATPGCATGAAYGFAFGSPGMLLIETPWLRDRSASNDRYHSRLRLAPRTPMARRRFAR